MPVIIPPGYAQVTFEFIGPLVPDGVAQIVFGTALGGGTPAEVAADWAEQYLVIWAASGSNQLTFNRALWVTEDTGGELIVDEAGGASGSPAPPNVSLLMRKVVSARGPRAKGRMYPPGLIFEEQIEFDGSIVPTTVEGRNDQFNTWLDAVPQNMVVLQNTEGISPPLSPPPIVNALLCDPKVATQRGRLR